MGFLNFAAGSTSFAGIGATVENAAKHAFVDAWMGGVKSFIYGTEMSPLRDAISGALSSLGNSGIDAYLPDNMALQTAAAAVLGGTVAEIGGGKFANGAVTGAYSMLFNDLAHKIKNELPSTYKYKNGEQIQVGGKTYQLNNGHWVKLSGEMIDVAALKAGQGGVYIPVASNMIDKAIYEDNMTVIMKGSVDGITTGIIIEGIATKVWKTNGLVISLQVLSNLYKTVIKQIKENLYHDSQVEKLRTNN